VKKTPAASKVKKLKKKKPAAGFLVKKSAASAGHKTKKVNHIYEAKRLAIPLSKDGHKKTKNQLLRAIAYRKTN
jgi:predicted cupin superfamily sugar epimerase